MKKIILFIAFFTLTLMACAQTPAWQSQDVGIRKRNPRVYFNGNWLGTSGTTGTTLYFNGVAVGAGGVTNWGAIGGVLATQADLQAALDLKSGYPGAGIPVSNGATWGASINNNSANWNTAYGWGNHAAAGYYSGTSATIRGLISSSATGLTYTSATGVFSFTGGYAIPAMYSQNNWNTAYGWGDHAGLYDPVGTGAGLVALHLSAYNHNNYNTAYNDRLKWDGGATGLTAATGRTSLELNNLTNKLQVEVEDSTGSAALTYLTGYQGSLKVPYSDVEDENVELAGGITSASVTTGGITSTTGTYTDLTVSGTLTATYNSDQFNLIAGTTIDGKHYEIEWEVDTTANAPAAGDSIYTDARFADMHVDVWCSDTVTGQLCLMNENYWEADKYSYEFTDATGVFTFHPKLATAQVVRIVGTNSARWATLTPPAAPFHAFYQAVYDGYTSKPSEAVANACNEWITALDTIDYWSGGTSVLDRCDLILVPAIDVNSTNEALMWWTDPDTYADAPNSPTWTALQGYAGNGTSSYISTNFNPSTMGTNFSQNSASVAIYVNTESQEDASLFGSSDFTNVTRLAVYTASNNNIARVNTNTDMSTASAASSGFWILTRRAAAETEYYRNGVSVEMEADASTAETNGELYVGRYVSNYSTRQWAIFMVFDKIYHDDEAAAITTVTEVFADEIGFGVIP